MNKATNNRFTGLSKSAAWPQLTACGIPSKYLNWSDQANLNFIPRTTKICTVASVT